MCKVNKHRWPTQTVKGRNTETKGKHTQERDKAVATSGSERISRPLESTPHLERYLTLTETDVTPF